MILIMDYNRLNKYIVINSSPLTRISEEMQQLQGFQYDTALDIKM